jgi:thioredoxin-related protein
MLYFGQDGCPYCRQLMEVDFGQRDIVDKTRAHFDAIALNLWGDRETVWLDGVARTEKQLGAYLNVQFTPTLLFLDERGNVVVRLNGLYPAHKFRAVLDYVAQHKESQVALADWVARAAGPPDSGVLHEHLLFMPPPLDLVRGPRAASKPLAVFFEQRHCGGCDEMHADVLVRDDTLALLRAFDVARVDVRSKRPIVTPRDEKTTEAQWARDLGVAYVPAILFFDAGGREVFRADAYLRAFHLQSALDYVASGAYRTQPSFQRFVQARADAMREKGMTIDLWR